MPRWQALHGIATTIEHCGAAHAPALETSRWGKSSKSPFLNCAARSVACACAQNLFSLSSFLSAEVSLSARGGGGSAEAEIAARWSFFQVQDREANAKSTTGLRNSFGARPPRCTSVHNAAD